MPGLRSERVLIGLAASAVVFAAVLLIAIIYGVQPGEAVAKVGLSAIILAFYGFLAAAAVQLRRQMSMPAAAVSYAALALIVAGAGAGFFVVWWTPSGLDSLRQLAAVLVAGATAGIAAWNGNRVRPGNPLAANLLNIGGAAAVLVFGGLSVHLILTASTDVVGSPGLLTGVDTSRLSAASLVVTLAAPILAGAVRRFEALIPSDPETD